MTKSSAPFADEISGPVLVHNSSGASQVLLVCEHASNFIPKKYASLGLDESTLQSHVAWDPGAMAVAAILSAILDATLVAGCVSRLIYDCNRPPDSPDAMPDRSEAVDIPGNFSLDTAERRRRTAQVYAPFQETLTNAIARQNGESVLVTVHSFTPIYMGQTRSVELGILHDSDSRLANAMFGIAPKHTELNVVRNSPYGPEDGVTHTLKLHGIQNGILNVMLEIRSDLIATPDQQEGIATSLAGFLSDAIASANTVSPNKASVC